MSSRFQEASMRAEAGGKGGFDPGELLRQLPTGVLVCNEHGNIVWLNAALERLFGVGSADVLGQGWDGLPIAAASPSGVVRRFRLLRAQSRGPHLVDCTSRTVLLGDDLVQVSCFTPVPMIVQTPRTATPVLRVLPGSRAVPEPGLLEEGAIESVLQAEVSRSRRYHNPLTVVLARVGSGSLREAARLLRDQVRWADLIGRRDAEELLLVLPETDAFAAVQLVHKLEDVLARNVANGEARMRLGVQFGVAEWRRGDNVGFLLERARADIAARYPGGR